MISRSLLTPFVHVWSEDPDLDHEHKDFAKAWKTFLESQDPAVLPVVTGGKLTTFRLAPLNRRQFQECSQLVRRKKDEPEDYSDAATRACAYALTSVENYTLPDGSTLDVERRKAANGESICTDATLDKLLYPDLIAELGMRALARSTLRPAKGQGSR